MTVNNLLTALAAISLAYCAVMFVRIRRGGVSDRALLVWSAWMTVLFAVAVTSFFVE